MMPQNRRQFLFDPLISDDAGQDPGLYMALLFVFSCVGCLLKRMGRCFYDRFYLVPEPIWMPQFHDNLYQLRHKIVFSRSGS